MESTRDEYKRKMEEVKKEYKNLKQGIIMELPEKMQAFFEEQNILLLLYLLLSTHLQIFFHIKLKCHLHTLL